MTRDRIRKMSLVGLFVLAVAALGYFAIVRRQPRQAPTTAQVGKDVYYCPMHKNYHSDKPGNCPICSMKLVKLESSTTPAATSVAMKSDPSSMPSMPGMPSSAPAAGATPANNAVFVPPEKQQLIGMRSVPAELGTLTKEIRIVGKVSYDETHQTHIHTKVSGYIEDVFADSVGKSVRAGEPLFTI